MWRGLNGPLRARACIRIWTHAGSYDFSHADASRKRGRVDWRVRVARGFAGLVAGASLQTLPDTVFSVIFLCHSRPDTNDPMLKPLLLILWVSQPKIEGASVRVFPFPFFWYVWGKITFFPLVDFDPNFEYFDPNFKITFAVKCKYIQSWMGPIIRLFS